MKKVLSVLAVSAFVLTASASFAGGPGKKMVGPGCPDACQDQIDGLQSKVDQQGEQLRSQSKEMQALAAQKAQKPAEVYNPWYVKVMGAWAMTSDPSVDNLVGINTDDGYGFGAAVGRQFGNFRVEGEIATQKSDIDGFSIGRFGGDRVQSGDIRIDTALINGFYSIPVAEGFSFYGMVGMGIAKVDVSIYNADDDTTTFAWKAGAGMTYAFAGNMAVDLGYEYLGVNDITLNGDLNVSDISSNNVVGAFRFMF